MQRIYIKPCQKINKLYVTHIIYLFSNKDTHIYEKNAKNTKNAKKTKELINNI